MVFYLFSKLSGFAKGVFHTQLQIFRNIMLKYIISREHIELLVCHFLLIYVHSLNQLFNEYLDEFPAILDSLFHKLVDATVTPIGVKSGEWQGVLTQKIYMPKWHQFRLF